MSNDHDAFPVGQAFTMQGTPAFTMAVFEAAKVPPGATVYAARTAGDQSVPGDEQTAMAQPLFGTQAFTMAVFKASAVPDGSRLYAKSWSAKVSELLGQAKPVANEAEALRSLLREVQEKWMSDANPDECASLVKQVESAIGTESPGADNKNPGRKP